MGTGPGDGMGRWMPFNDAADALRWHLEHQQPWGPTTWLGYLNRSARWHLEMIALRDEEEWKQIKNARCESLVTEVELGGFRAVPVTEGVALYCLSREMGNCLASYVPRCVEGSTRIFASYDRNGQESEPVHRQGEHEERLVGAGELRCAGEHFWKVGQTERPRVSSREVVQAMNEIERLYRAAARSQTTPARLWEAFSGLFTGPA